MKKVFQINEFPYSVRYPKIVAFFQNGKMKIMKTRGCVFHFLPENWQWKISGRKFKTGGRVF